MASIYQQIFFSVAICLFLSTFTGCFGQDYHAKQGWNAEDYFSDPQVINLCAAIRANDLDQIEQLVKAGANVNAKGKHNMTPLLWAFPDNKLPRFQKLLELGADPNVVIESDFNSKGQIHAGHSVTHLAATTAFPGYFKQVMKHGGDAHLLDRKSNETLVHAIISSPAPNKKERIQLLLDKKVDLDHISNLYDTAVMRAVGWGGQYDIALMLLEAGADPKVYRAKSNKKLIHVVAQDESRASRSSDNKMKSEYNALVKWLAERGESLAKAKADNERWMEWGKLYSPSEARRLIEREVAERKAREAAEEKKAEEEKSTIPTKLDE